MPIHRSAAPPRIVPAPWPTERVLVRRLHSQPVGPPARYDRRWDLSRLLAMWPEEIADETIAGRERVMVRLRQALRAERQRGVAGHWTYDLTRHAQLLSACRHERLALAQARAASKAGCAGSPAAAE